MYKVYSNSNAASVDNSGHSFIPRRLDPEPGAVLCLPAHPPSLPSIPPIRPQQQPPHQDDYDSGSDDDLEVDSPSMQRANLVKSSSRAIETGKIAIRRTFPRKQTRDRTGADRDESNIEDSDTPKQSSDRSVSPSGMEDFERRDDVTGSSPPGHGLGAGVTSSLGLRTIPVSGIVRSTGKNPGGNLSRAMSVGTKPSWTDNIQTSTPADDEDTDSMFVPSVRSTKDIRNIKENTKKRRITSPSKPSSLANSPVIPFMSSSSDDADDIHSSSPPSSYSMLPPSSPISKRDAVDESTFAGPRAWARLRSISRPAMSPKVQPTSPLIQSDSPPKAPAPPPLPTVDLSILSNIDVENYVDACSESDSIGETRSVKLQTALEPTTASTTSTTTSPPTILPTKTGLQQYSLPPTTPDLIRPEHKAYRGSAARPSFLAGDDPLKRRIARHQTPLTSSGSDTQTPNLTPPSSSAPSMPVSIEDVRHTKNARAGWKANSANNPILSLANNHLSTSTTNPTMPSANHPKISPRFVYHSCHSNLQKSTPSPNDPKHTSRFSIISRLPIGLYLLYFYGYLFPPNKHHQKGANTKQRKVC